MLWDRIALLLAFTHLVEPKQPSAPSTIKAPLRELPWGKLNFLHTTDTHGWHAGHLREAQYSADWGDYISFAHHLHRRADADGSDLLLVDTGDRVEGNGLYDTSNPPGKYTFDIVKNQQFDVVTVGNHELYINTTSAREYDEVVPLLKDSYIASNVDIHNPKDGTLVPLARRFRKFKTKNQGITILAFGFLFDFQGNANNTVVQRVEDTVKEAWFQDAIREKDIDLFVVAGHVPVRDTKEFDAVYQAIREAKWDTPIVFFGGHTHIRDYRKWEKKAYGIESGRYMETIGFLSISGVGGSRQGAIGILSNPKYDRRYIDNNLYSFHHHSGTNESTFDTALGRNVSNFVREARSSLNLDKTFGCAPHDFWLSRAPYPSNDSLLTWLETQVLPDTFTDANKSNTRPALIVTNTGALRFDIFEGPFTTDSTYLLSPFKSAFRMIKDVPYDAAAKVLKLLNNEGPILLEDLRSFAVGNSRLGELDFDGLVPSRAPVRASELLDRRIAEAVVQGSFRGADAQVPMNGEKRDDEPQVPGYTTKDDAGDDGDDTIHKQIQFYRVPNCIAAEVGFSSSTQTEDDEKLPANVDIVYNEFIEKWILLALQYLGVDYGKENTRSALDGMSMTQVIENWVAKHWECKDGDDTID